MAYDNSVLLRCPDYVISFERQKLTPREIRIARAAFIEGAEYNRSPGGYEEKREAVLRYPLQTMTRPRAVPDDEQIGVWWRLQDGKYLCASGRDGSIRLSPGHSVYTPTVARVKLWADLVARPTEEVEADE